MSDQPEGAQPIPVEYERPVLCPTCGSQFRNIHLRPPGPLVTDRYEMCPDPWHAASGRRPSDGD